MNTLEIIILVLVVVVLALAIGGYVASGRRHRADRGTLDAELEAANAALAVAHLDDKGWERALLEVFDPRERDTLIGLLRRMHENLPAVEVATERYLAEHSLQGRRRLPQERKQT